MAYTDSNTKWSFSVPQAGETDDVEDYTKHIEAIDAALVTPDNKAQLLGRGASSATVTDTTYVKDNYQTELAGEDVYVTNLHKHPTPTRVPLADDATEAEHAKKATEADEADKLTTAHTINGLAFNGTADITIEPDNIPLLNRVYWGTVKPASYGGFRSNLHAGDLYVEIYD